MKCICAETRVKCEGPADEHRKSLPARREGKCHGLEIGMKGEICGMFQKPNGGLSGWSQ